MALIIVAADSPGTEDAIERLSTSLSGIKEIEGVIRKFTNMAQREAVANVSNNGFVYDGRSIFIRRRTGKLARSIQVVSVTPLSGALEASAEYAEPIEEGHGPVDMKPYLMGKTVMIPIAGRTQGMPDSGGRISFFTDAENGRQSVKVTRISKKATTGRKAGVQNVIFRRIGPNTKGFIIPRQPPKPFMSAAGQKVEEPFRNEIEDVLSRYYSGEE